MARLGPEVGGTDEWGGVGQFAVLHCITNMGLRTESPYKQPKNANLVHFFLYDCRTIVQIRVELNPTILLVTSNDAYHVVENALVVRMICGFCKYLV